MRLFDSHCHLQDAAFGGEALSAIDRAREAGVVGMVVLGYDEPSNLAALELSRQRAGVFAATGFHPHDAKDVAPPMLDTLAEQVGLPEVVAVGELGLDFYRDISPRGRQLEVLDAQLAIALAADKPVCVHSRGAETAIFEPLARYSAAARRIPGVMHCFGGTLEDALRFVALGFSVSVACTVTYPKNHEARRIAAELPLESLLIETDSPYLPPQRMRGGRNEPSFLVAAAEAVAAVRGLDVHVLAEATTANAERLFGVRAPAPELAGSR
jgi:TatD DNase family protein